MIGIHALFVPATPPTVRVDPGTALHAPPLIEYSRRKSKPSAIDPERTDTEQCSETSVWSRESASGSSRTMPRSIHPVVSVTVLNPLELLVISQRRSASATRGWNLGAEPTCQPGLVQRLNQRPVPEAAPRPGTRLRCQELWSPAQSKRSRRRRARHQTRCPLRRPGRLANHHHVAVCHRAVGLQRGNGVVAAEALRYFSRDNLRTNGRDEVDDSLAGDVHHGCVDEVTVDRKTASALRISTISNAAALPVTVVGIRVRSRCRPRAW